MGQGGIALRRAWPATAAVLLVAALAAAPSSASGLDQTCILPLTKFDAGTVNVAYPDEAAIYWVGGYQAMEGTRIRIRSEFPHARYMSFHAYDPALRPIDAIHDVSIQPDPGSSNPFLGGADRIAHPRSYTAFIEFGAKPERPAPNTIYTGTGQNGAPNMNGGFVYRIYVPDRGRDETGGVGLPQVSLETKDSSDPPLTPVDCRRAAKPTASGISDAVADASGLAALDNFPFPGHSPPRWNKFVNLPTSVLGVVAGNERGQPIYDALAPTLVQAGGKGGFGSNLDNAYMTAAISRGFGRILVVRGKAPTYPDTRAGTPRMRAGPQLRYWSMCQNETATQRFIACRTDDQTGIGADGYFTYVLSTRAERPANARPECGVTWIPWGPSWQGVLIYRHMLPDPDFAQAIQRAELGKEAGTMEEYLPIGRYLPDQAAFEKRGCPAT